MVFLLCFKVAEGPLLPEKNVFGLVYFAVCLLFTFFPPSFLQSVCFPSKICNIIAKVWVSLLIIKGLITDKRRFYRNEPEPLKLFPFLICRFFNIFFFKFNSLVQCILNFTCFCKGSVPFRQSEKYKQMCLLFGFNVFISILSLYILMKS